VNMNATGGGLFQVWALNDLSMFGFGEPNINPNPEALIPLVTAQLRYVNELGLPVGGGCDPSLPTSPPPVSEADEAFLNQQLLQPYDRVLAPASSNQQIVLVVDNVDDANGVNHLTFNDIIYSAPTTQPLLTLVMTNQTPPATTNSFQVAHNQVIDIVVNNHDTGPHPFHLHGHTFFVMGYGLEGDGDYNPSNNTLIRNGVRRDTVVVPTGSWAVLRFIADNPGVWFFHCHIDWHLQSGLAATIVEAADVLQSSLTIPLVTRRICAANGISLT